MLLLSDTKIIIIKNKFTNLSIPVFIRQDYSHWSPFEELVASAAHLPNPTKHYVKH